MSVKDKIRWLKAAAQLLVSVESFLCNIGTQVNGKDKARLARTQAYAKAAWTELQEWIVKLGGYN